MGIFVFTIVTIIIMTIGQDLANARSSAGIHNIKLVLEYYAGREQSQTVAKRPRSLIQRSFLQSIKANVDEYFGFGLMERNSGTNELTGVQR